ncbi:hypothetical protein BKP45_08105 [Anaerobacillus alkalidiazotrophicus]|uniref:PvuRts1 I-like SET and RING associated domain-containing protein n=2 Tax=Anaerobacillus alkalidiazotrophicus TaxID=472963 RepID=A0A1S2M7I2_9BACI|nr:hypothetical protein BKP45_08105 [Anaerobacillus alkalidiazotrophicus]
MEYHINSNIHKRIVFAGVKSPLGGVIYKFKGEFNLDVEQSYEEQCLVWKRLATRVKTYKPLAYTCENSEIVINETIIQERT